MLKINITLAIITFTIVFIIFTGYKANSKAHFDDCLFKSSEAYKKNFMTKDGRIMDPKRNNITTSEGQSYMLLRSLALNDKKTFDLVYKWTKNNLQRKDFLFAWLWGESIDGTYKILDKNSASDADVDIAFSLILAYEKWGNPYYLKEAKNIINSIWENETRRIGPHLVLSPGVIQNTTAKIELNPSYFSPYAFRFFQKYDELHDWNQLIDSSYYYLNEVTKYTKTHLPPDWFLIKNGKIVLENNERSDFSYDAIRVYFRIHLDYVRTGEKRALPILEKSKFFIEQWKTTQKFYTNYKANGELRDKTEYLGSIIMLLPTIKMYDPNFADKINKLTSPDFNDNQNWLSKNDYYGKNLSWFGCYFYHSDSDPYKEWHKRRIRIDNY